MNESIFLKMQKKKILKIQIWYFKIILVVMLMLSSVTQILRKKIAI